MKLDCVLTAVNENPLYLEFIPLFIKTWKKLYKNIDVKIILILSLSEYNKIINSNSEYKKYNEHLILFDPISLINSGNNNISTAFISQYIRILYPSILNYKNGILITDMDMIPMNRNYFTKNIEDYNNSKFIYYRDNVCFNYKELAICYNVAIPETWREIFNINSLNDIVERLKNVYQNINYIDGHGNSGWSTDQLDLYKYVMNWNKKTNNLICLNERKTKFKRLDRSQKLNINDITLKNNIKNGLYSDYHCLRPFSKFKDINNKIYELL